MKYTAEIRQKMEEWNKHRVKPLTKEDITWMRKAPTVVLEFAWNYGTPEAHARGMEARKRQNAHPTGENSNLPRIVYKIPVKMKFDLYYGNSGIESMSAPIKATTLIDYMEWEGQQEHFKALAYFLKAGDLLTIEWQFSAGNQYTEAAKLNTYRTFAIVERGKRKYKFLLDAIVMPNNTASPVKFY